MNQTDIAGNSVNISKWLSEGWNHLFSDFWQYIGLTCIYLIILGTVATTGIGVFLVAGPLNVGFFFIIANRLFDKPILISDISKGFSYYVNAILAQILISFFLFLGFMFCFIPFIFIYAWYLFVYIYIFDRDLDFWNAMEESRKVIFNHMFEFLVLAVIFGVVFFIGLMLCGIGVIVAIPYIKIVTIIAYRDLIGFNKTY